MIKVERHYIKGTPEIIHLCSMSKELYNRCNFIIRQSWFNKKKSLKMVELTNKMREFDCFKNLHNTKTAKQTIRKCIVDWINFKKALFAWDKDKSKFIKKPRPPKYKDKLAQVIFYKETICKIAAKKGIITPTNKCFYIKSDKKFKQIIITPKTFGFIVDVVYHTIVESEKEKEGICSKNKSCFIDLGVNNLCTITSDQQIRPVLVNGRPLKSINQWFNKHQSKVRSRKRYFRTENYFHHVSKFIIQYCIANGINQIIIGKNNGWKQKMKMLKNINQNFQYIAFYKLMEKIRYKAEIKGIKVIFIEESYTSQASAIDGDSLPKYNKNNIPPLFSGKRKYRGLYVTKNGFAIHADVNGSLNIGRKVIPEFLPGIGDRSLAARPVRINPLKIFAHNIYCGADKDRLILQTQNKMV
jgi:putative transposase